MFLTIEEAVIWATNYINKKILKHNIQYLITNGNINNYNGKVKLEELKNYYDELKNNSDWNHELSFSNITESERTKHVHKLHPYKGKFIPQLVEYFLDKYFEENNIILDPFCGSGTTLIQANEQNIHSIGIELSPFNCKIIKFKLADFDIDEFETNVKKLLSILEENYDNNIKIFEKELKKALIEFNKSIDSKQIKKDIKNKNISKNDLKEIEDEFMVVFNKLTKKYNIKIKNDNSETFLKTWFTYPIQKEIEIIKNYIENIEDKNMKDNLIVFCSRVIRSVRATPHNNLEQLKNPVYKPYFCFKHFKICKPNYSLIPTFKRYLKDTIQRLKTYKKIKTNSFQEIIEGDSRNIDILPKIKNKEFKNLIETNKIDGIITSPPYFGQLNYHFQHEYSYDIFEIKKKEESEIGSSIFGKSKKAKERYINDIVSVLINIKKYLKKDALIIIIVDDKENLYSEILNKAGLKEIERIKRPVLHRTSQDNNKYYEDIIIAQPI
jgi:DNA modification methylase